MAQTRKPSLRQVKAPVPDYALRVELQYIEPAIWRRIIVPGSIRLGKLHFGRGLIGDTGSATFHGPKLTINASIPINLGRYDGLSGYFIIARAQRNAWQA
jgi:hypothetical protein